MIPVQDLDPGQKVKLKSDAIAEVVQNPRDGIWVMVRYVSAPQQTELERKDELVHCDDVAAIL
jgi:hypothetical protein